MAAEPIHGCSTTPMGMKTPGQGKDDTHATAQRRGAPLRAAHCEVLLLGVAQTMCQQAVSELGRGAVKGTGLTHPPWPSRDGPQMASRVSGGAPREQGTPGTRSAAFVYL